MKWKQQQHCHSSILSIHWNMEWTAFSDVAIPACKSHWPKLVSTNNIEIQSNQTARVNKSNNNIKWRNTRYNICVAWWIEGAAEKKNLQKRGEKNTHRSRNLRLKLLQMHTNTSSSSQHRHMNWTKWMPVECKRTTDLTYECLCYLFVQKSERMLHSLCEVQCIRKWTKLA